MWPVTHIPRILSLRGKESDPSASRPKAIASDMQRLYSWGPVTPSGIVNMHLGDVFYAGVGFAVWFFTWPKDLVAGSWPSWSEFATSWVALVFARNLVLEICFYEFWHQLLFGVLKTSSVSELRFSTSDPYCNTTQVRRERFFTVCGFVWSSFYECIIVYMWASATIPHCDAAQWGGPFSIACRMETPGITDFSTRPMFVIWFVAAFIITTQFRGIHFFFCHRMMHPWWDQHSGLLQGDIGAFLYRHVHSLHHKSYNPGPWSSLSMHPVEHILYFSCFFIAFFIPYHPLHLLLNKFHTDISALAGHDGHAAPGAADVGHYLHHAHFECNYGFSFPNYLDKLFGTFEDGTKYHSEAEVVGSSLQKPLLGGSVTAEEVAKHARPGDAWMILHGVVLDVTRWANEHPGGAKVIHDNAGKDATKVYDMMHSRKGGMTLVDKFAVLKLGKLEHVAE